MTIYSPSILIQRARFTSAQHVVYDQKFHSGINIIAGENSVGKTSVIQLLMHGLGYAIEDTDWKEEAKKCDVFLELKINNHIITIKRERRDSYDTYQIPMLFCLKDMDQSLTENFEKWERYPYRKTDLKESFSTNLFHLLNIPSVKENDKNINLNNIFRLLYSAQERSLGTLFNYQPFDSKTAREDIANYLLNTYDNGIVILKKDLEDAEKELDKLKNEIQSFHSVAQKFSQNFIMDGNITNDTINDEIGNINLKIDKQLKEIEILQQQSINDLTVTTEKKELTKDNTKLSTIKSKISKVQQDISFFEYDIVDSKNFINELSITYNSVGDAISISSSLEAPKFSHCPACFTVLKSENIDKDMVCCNICHTDTSSKELNLLQMKHELHMQLKESKKILNIKKVKLDKLKGDLKALYQELKRFITEVKVTEKAINLVNDKKIYELYSHIAKLQVDIQDLQRSAKAYNYIHDITDKRNQIQNTVNDLTDKIEAMSSNFHTRLSKNDLILKQFLKNLLEGDIRDKDFKNIKSIDLNFGNDSLVLNNKSLSASSTGYLYHSLLIALLLSSLELDYLRVPRIAIIDGLDSNGIDEDRLKNFQNIIKNQLESYNDIQHQLFFTTGIVSGELKTNIIGQFYREGEHTLNFA